MKLSDNFTSLNRLETNLLYLLLLRYNAFAFLPELFEALGENTEQMNMLLYCFAGCTVTFPTVEQLEKYANEIRIYLRTVRANKMQINDVREALAVEFDMKKEEVNAVVERIRALVKEFGISL